MQKYFKVDPLEITTTKLQDLEQDILDCWKIVDDLDHVFQLIDDNDKAHDLVMAIKVLYDAKFEELWENFESIYND